ncbi:MAG: hypothetical protein WC307_03930 [Candidatus Nanoarchaeia archaeon]|jgi:small-conductance mechanosensitive channel
MSITNATDAGATVFTIFDQLGITNYVIPFILIMTALYAVMMKIKLPTDNAKLNGMLAFAIAYMFIAFGGGMMISALLPSFLVLFLLIFIALLFYMFVGVGQESITKVLSNPVIVLFIVILLVIFTFVALQDWIIFSDRIPAYRVSEQGELLPEAELNNYTGNTTSIEGKPNSILVNGVEYVLIEGLYYKQGYEGAAYAIGQPQVVGSILIFIVLGIVTALIVWPKND